MSSMASQIIGVSIVCSTVYWDADQRKHQSSTSLALVRGLHRWPVDFPQVTGGFPSQRECFHLKMFPFDDVIMNLGETWPCCKRPETRYLQWVHWWTDTSWLDSSGRQQALCHQAPSSHCYPQCLGKTNAGSDHIHRLKLGKFKLEKSLHMLHLSLVQTLVSHW